MTAPDFSLVLGGPLFQLLRRAHLTDDALRLQRRRVVAIVLLAWLPLLLPAAAGGELLGGTVAVPFLFDVDVHVKFLVALPLLVVAELVVHQRMRAVVVTFRERRLIPDGANDRLEAAVASAYRWRNSVLAEVLLIAIVYGVGVMIVWRYYTALDAATWYATPTADETRLTPAGVWYGYVSLPVFQFLLCRWYFRILIWARLLWQVSRIGLNLVPTHPDRVGGLGFLAATTHAFILLLVFAPQLAAARRTGLREYGTLAQGYVRDFDAKWVRRTGSTDEPLLGSGDIQSLADLGNSYAVIQDMRILPVTKQAMLQLAVATVVPLVPLVLTLMPLEELLRKLLGILF